MKAKISAFAARQAASMMIRHAGILERAVKRHDWRPAESAMTLAQAGILRDVAGVLQNATEIEIAAESPEVDAERVMI